MGCCLFLPLDAVIALNDISVKDSLRYPNSLFMHCAITKSISLAKY